MRASLPVAFLALAAAAPAQNLGLTLVNGVDTHIDAGPAPTLVPRGGLTIEAWVTYDDASLGSGWRWPTIVRQNPTPQQERFFFRVNAADTNSTVLGFKVRTTTGSFAVTWPFAPGQLNAFTHVAATFDGQSVKIIVNGTEVASAPASGVLDDIGDVLRIGNGDVSAPSPGIEVWNGHVDEVRLWPFARTAAEIASTMNVELSSVPGEVSTWNLNGNGMDSSGSNHGTAVGTLNWAANSLSLPPFLPAPGLPFGTPTAGCAGAPLPAVAGLPRSGNAGFGMVCLRATVSGAGVLWLSPRPLSTPFPFLGAQVWIDVALPGIQVPVVGGPLATSHVGLPIPASVRGGLHGQLFFVETGCSTPLIASSALTVIIRP